ncbi:MAG TPA: fumarylacetoacetate hydrolase family protein [Allosphingosinicella sp.]|nr:fumarylacetoacetate hydrolase family protein [Allosphingosinicella sp.]
MDKQMQRAAADLLYGHWMQGTRLANLPEDLRPVTRSEGYAIQGLLEERSAMPLFGWKIAATSAAGQAHIAVDGPLAGRILSERVIPENGFCPFGNNLMKVAELEFAFRMGTTLEPRQTAFEVEEVLAKVTTLHPAIEVPDSRFEPFEKAGAAQLIADNACGHYFVLGELAPEEWRELDLAAHPVAGYVNGVAVGEGFGRNVLGDPRLALHWLANELSRHNIPLRAGQVVTTGTCMTPLAIAPGDLVSGDFGPIGNISIRFERD